jgi:hypothetical protein
MTGLIMISGSKKKVFLSLKGIGQQSVCKVWEFWICDTIQQCSELLRFYKQSWRKMRCNK